MRRNEILAKFKTLRFCVFWPKNWDDIGFTEHPIWVNSLGFGYYSDDEPCNFAVIKNISDRNIRDLKQKIIAHEISIEDLKSTPFSAIDTYADDDYMEGVMQDFLLLPDHVNGCVYCGEDFDGWRFFTSEEELTEAFDKIDDFNGGEAWKDMNDEALIRWHDRIFDKTLDFILPLTVGITKNTYD